MLLLLLLLYLKAKAEEEHEGGSSWEEKKLNWLVEVLELIAVS